MDDDQHSAEIPEQVRVRLGKRERLLAEGTDPYPVAFPRTHTIAEVRDKYPDLPADTATGEHVGVTGRVMLSRIAGKLCFATIRRAMPSTCPAKPKMIPDWSASTVFLPITCGGRASSTLSNCAARRERASTDISIPGAKAPPTNSPRLLMASKLVDVPKSTTCAGPP